MRKSHWLPTLCRCLASNSRFNKTISRTPCAPVVMNVDFVEFIRKCASHAALVCMCCVSAIADKRPMLPIPHSMNGTTLYLLSPFISAKRRCVQRDFIRACGCMGCLKSHFYYTLYCVLEHASDTLSTTPFARKIANESNRRRLGFIERIFIQSGCFWNINGCE